MSTLAQLLGSWLLVNSLILLFCWLAFVVIPGVTHRVRAKVRTVVLLRDIERLRR